MSDSAIVTFALIAAVAGIAYGIYLAMWVFKLDAGNAKMQEIAKAIQEGAGAYMNRQYRTVGYVAAGLFVILAAAGAVSDKFGLLTAVGFLVESIATAATATPYNPPDSAPPQIQKLPRIAAAITTTGAAVACMPTAKPAIMLVAWPVSLALAMYFTGS